jgi:hypothetical protein
MARVAWDTAFHSMNKTSPDCRETTILSDVRGNQGNPTAKQRCLVVAQADSLANFPYPLLDLVFWPEGEMWLGQAQATHDGKRVRGWHQRLQRLQ